MKFKFTLVIDGAEDKEQAIDVINEMLDHYDFDVRPVPEDDEDQVTIDWPSSNADADLPTLDE